MFLSIVTRTHNRPDMLARNMASIQAQSCQDLEHVILHDSAGRGIAWANGQYARYAPALSGEYVMMLDDDNVLCDPDAVAILRKAAASGADILQFRADVGPHGILPNENSWMKPPRIYNVDGHTLAVKRSAWLTHIDMFGGDRCADFRFIAALWESECSVEWLDVVLVKAMAVGSLGWTAQEF